MSQRASLHRTIFIGAIASISLALACGSGGSPAEDACTTAAERLFALCNVNDPTDLDTIKDALRKFGFFPTDAEIREIPQDEAVDFCVDELDGLDVTDEDAEFANSFLNAATNCQSVVGTIESLVDQL